jgi:hypothetical protein
LVASPHSYRRAPEVVIGPGGARPDRVEGRFADYALAYRTWRDGFVDSLNGRG